MEVWNYGFHSARTLTPEAAYQVIRDGVSAAIARLDSFRPFVVSQPTTLEVRFKNYRPVEMLSYLPIVERTDSHTIRYIADTMIEISKFIEFITTYSIALDP